MNEDKALFDNWMQKQASINGKNPIPGFDFVYPGLYPDFGGVYSQQVVDAVFYATKTISGVSSFDNMFKTDDNLSVGLTNVSKATIPANTFFLLTGISLQYAVASGATDDLAKVASFVTPLPAAILNGEISINVDTKAILSKMLINVFSDSHNILATGDTNAAAGTPVTYTTEQRGSVGYYRLKVPKMLTPQKLIEIRLVFAAAAANNAALRVVFHGVANATA